MINFFEKIDLLGSKFHFYDDVSLKKRTVVGGILSLFLGISTIIFSLYFGKDLFLRINPNVTISIQNDSKYEYLDLKKENIVFAFRIEDFNGHFINESNILYFKIFYYSSIPDEEGKYRSKSSSEFVYYHICNNNDFLKNENLTKNYGTLFCADFEGKKFGGYWDNPYIFFFEIQIYFCENGNNYSINNKCTSLKNLKKIFNKNYPAFFSIYYPVIEFDPFSYNNPLKVRYKNYHYDLSHLTQRSDIFQLKKTILNDDKGWLFNEKNNISYWGIDKITSSYKFYTEDELIIEGTSSKIYSLTIMNTIENNLYIRNYIKIQNVIAIVGTLFNLIFKISLFITHCIGESLRKLEILNNYFEFEENCSKNKTFNSKCSQSYIVFNTPSSISKNKTFKKRKNIVFYNDENLFQNDKKKLKIQSTKTLNINSFNNNNPDKNIINTTEQSRVKFIPKRKSVSFTNTKFLNYENENFMKSNLTLKHIIQENIKIYLFFCCTNRKHYTQYFNIKQTNLLQFYYIKLIQINRYIRNVQEFDFLKKYLLNVYQIKSLFFLKRINLTNKRERDNICENKNSQNIEEQVVRYFKSMIKTNGLSKIDKFILLNLSEDIKNKI